MAEGTYPFFLTVALALLGGMGMLVVALRNALRQNHDLARTIALMRLVESTDNPTVRALAVKGLNESLPRCRPKTKAERGDRNDPPAKRPGLTFTSKL